MKYVLDTNVVSELRKRHPHVGVTAWFGARQTLDLYVSAITIFELDLGVRRVERRDAQQGMLLRRWLEEQVAPQFDGRILPLDERVARAAAAFQVPDPRPERDCFIAATASAYGMTVVTRNTSDFARIGVGFINPWS